MRHHLHDLTHGGQPRPAREGGQVGRAGRQVVDGVGRRRRPVVGAVVVGRSSLLELGHPGARALAGHQEALGYQLLVGLDDHAPTHREVPGKLPAGREPAAAGEPARPDGGAQLVGDLVGQAAGGSVDPQVQVQEWTPILIGDWTFPAVQSSSSVRP